MVVHLLQALPGAAVFLTGFAESGTRFKMRMREAVPFRLRETLVPKGLGLGTGKDVGAAAKLILGGGGGQPGLATAGGKDIAGLSDALEALKAAATR